MIGPTGLISFPLAGQVRAAGQTPERLEKLLKTRLRDSLSIVNTADWKRQLGLVTDVFSLLQFEWQSLDNAYGTTTSRAFAAAGLFGTTVISYDYGRRARRPPPSPWPDSNKDYDAQIAGGRLTIYSGNGASTTFQAGGGGASRDFSYAFDYTAPGRYTPSFMLTGSFAQTRDE